ncbi:MAG: hypothetical protein ACI4JK_08370 [Oscillospiraceae bacterium]
MVLSIIFTAVYLTLMIVFPLKGRKTMPTTVKTAFMLGLPILGVFAIIQEKLVERKYSGLFSELTDHQSNLEQYENLKPLINPSTDIFLPILIGFVGAIAVVIGMVKVLKYPLTEEMSEYSKELTGSLASDYRKKCAGYISTCGIIIDVCSLLFMAGFVIYFAQIIPKIPEIFDTAVAAIMICGVLIFLTLIVPFAFLLLIAAAGYLLSLTAVIAVISCLPQILGMIMCCFGFGMTFTAAAVVSICAVVRMKKSGEFTTGKTVLYIIGSLIPIVNLFTLIAIKKASY